MALAIKARLSSGVMARFVGGPKTEFINGRSAIMRGLAGSPPISMTETTSLPGGPNTAPVSLKLTLLSPPANIRSASTGWDSAAKAASAGTMT